MNILGHTHTIEIIESLADIEGVAWDACAGEDNPFVSYDFLKSLEESGSVSSNTGWAPRHILIRNSKDQLAACMPVYLKGHSHGEYVFDWNWAEAFEQAGGDYYPKLLSGVPFTPVTGPRLLLHPKAPPELRVQLLKALSDLASSAHLSSAHVNFIPKEQMEAFSKTAFLPRTGLQYHWHNNAYTHYDDFLEALSSRKRKALKKERCQALDDGTITIERLCGDEIHDHHWESMYGFYRDTSARKWGQAYLNRAFFQHLGTRMADRILLVMATRNGKIIAGALNFIGSEALYGRYWGCTENIKCLHFEVCYHQAIEAAIERGLKRVEAGAQGEHKIARGYQPELTHSAHFITDEGFRDAVSSFLDQERQMILKHQAALLAKSPYRKDIK